MDDIKVKMTGTLTGPLKQMQEEIPIAEKRALYRAAYFLRDKIRQSLTSNVPKATQPNPRYNDTLVDAVGFSKVDGASVNVNALGAGRKGSGAFRARFFEKDTKDRYQKTYNGIKLKNKRFLGHITGTNFFSSAVDANEAAVVQIMQDVLGEFVQETFSK